MIAVEQPSVAAPAQTGRGSLAPPLFARIDNDQGNRLSAHLPSRGDTHRPAQCRVRTLPEKFEATFLL
jgi:hypothetical protein